MSSKLSEEWREFLSIRYSEEHSKCLFSLLLVVYSQHCHNLHFILIIRISDYHSFDSICMVVWTKMVENKLALSHIMLFIRLH